VSLRIFDASLVRHRGCERVDTGGSVAGPDYPDSESSWAK